MIKNVLTEIGGIAAYGVISIVLFFLVFSGALLWAWRLKQPFLHAMSALPLQDGTQPATPDGEQPHE